MQSKQDLHIQKNFIGFKSKVYDLHRELDSHWPVVSLREGEAGPEEYRAYIKLLFNTYDKLARMLSGSGSVVSNQLLALGRKALAEDAAILAIKRETVSGRIDFRNVQSPEMDLQKMGMSFDLGAAYVLSASSYGASMIYKTLSNSDYGLFMPTNFVQLMSAEPSLARYQRIKSRILRDLHTNEDWVEAQLGAETIFKISINEVKKIEQSNSFRNVTH